MDKKNFASKNAVVVALAYILIAALCLYSKNIASIDEIVTIAIIVTSVGFWMLEIMPLALALLSMMMTFIVCGITTMSETASALGSDTAWLVLSMLIISEVVKITLLPRRIAYRLISLCNGKIDRLILAIMTFCFLLSIFIPSTVGKAAVTYPIALELCNVIDKEGGNIKKIIMPAIVMVSTIGAFGFVTGSPTTFATGELFKSCIGFQWGYFSWVAAFLPIALIVIVLMWLYIKIFMLKGKQMQSENDLHSFTENIGALTTGEKKVIGFYILLFVLWGLKDITGLSMTVSSCVVMCIIFFPGVKIAEWKDITAKVNWNIIIIMTSGISISVAVKNSGLSDLAVVFIENNAVGLSAFSKLAIIALVIVLVRLVFVNNIMMVSLFLPIIFTLSDSLGFNPIWLGMFSFQFVNMAFLLPTQSVESITIFGYGDYDKKDYFRLGISTTIINCITIVVIAFTYWPLIGYAP